MIRLRTPFLEMEWKPSDADKDAAWELYTELLIRITTQELGQSGDEKTALGSVYAIFGLTRDTIKRHGRQCEEFTKIAIPILNQVIRPFTAKWHKVSINGFNHNESIEFRDELSLLQDVLKRYCKMLADMAGVEDLTDLEN